MTTLSYKSHSLIEDLAINECTVHRASGSGASRWWLLWFRVLRDSDGQAEDFCVSIAPNGSYNENGPGGRTWGINKPAATPYGNLPGKSNWLVSPSINILDDRDARPGTQSFPSIWHQTPYVLNVPDDEPWASGAEP